MTNPLLNDPRLPEAFWSKTEEIANGCWLWSGPMTAYGYGSFRVATRTRRRAHRMSYEALVGQIPDGLHLDHLCHNADTTCAGGDEDPHRRCVNPSHLEPVTASEHIARSALNTATRNSRKTHCPQGHPYDETNTRTNANGRTCRACSRAHSARRRAAFVAAGFTVDGRDRVNCHGRDARGRWVS